MWRRHDESVPVAIIDVGSNTVRLHLQREGELVAKDKAMLRLGESVERFGTIPETKLAEVSGRISEFATKARRAGVKRMDVVVTSPGRQAENGPELMERISRAAGVQARLLSSEEEGRLGFLGAVNANRGSSRKVIAVVDVGGGSAQIAVGTRRDGPTWVRSIDIGSMRLTSRMLTEDPPGATAAAAARAEVDRLLQDVTPPAVEGVLVVGGSARALRALVGSRLGEEELREAIEILARTPSAEIVEEYTVDEQRVRTLTGGAVILAAIQARLGLPLKVVRGGVREGAAHELEQRQLAA